MMSIRNLMIAAAFGLSTTVCLAQGYKAGAIEIQRPHARATGAGQPVGGGFVTLKNAGAADRLLSASAEVAASVELHTMRMEGDVMRMRQVDAIDLPAGQTVELKPGGLHLMLMGLKSPLKAGDSVALTLRFERAGEVTVPFRIEAAGAAAGMKHPH